MKKIEPPNNYLKSSAPEKSKFTRHCGKGSSKMNDLAYADNDYSMDEDLDSSSISTVYARHQRNFEKNCFNRRQQMSVHKRLGNCNSKWQPQGLKRYSNNYDMKLMKFAAQNQVVNDFASPVISALTQMKPICQEVIKSLSKKMLGEINGTAGPAASKDLKYNIEIQKEIFNLQVIVIHLVFIV